MLKEKFNEQFELPITKAKYLCLLKKYLSLHQHTKLPKLNISNFKHRFAVLFHIFDKLIVVTNNFW